MKPITVPQDVRTMVEGGAALSISISGGKDSQAQLNALAALHRAEGWRGPLFAIHADLGRAEWPQTPGHVESICQTAGVELVIVRREQGDLVDRWQERMEKLAGTGKPFWSSASQRYCTSDLKRGPIQKHQRRFSSVVSAIGIRAQESHARAKKVQCEPDSHLDNSVRDALNWRPILDWTIEDVWEACGTSVAELEERRFLYRLGWEEEAFDGWPAHPAYVMGNDRLSCALCILGSPNDLRNGARHNPALFQTLVGMERESGFTFRQGFALADLENEL